MLEKRTVNGLSPGVNKHVSGWNMIARMRLVLNTNVGLLLTVTGVLTTCAVVSSESR